MYKDNFIVKMIEASNKESFEEQITELLTDTMIEYNIVNIQYKVLNEVDTVSKVLNNNSFIYSALIILRRK